jgi:hypothetical protein
MKFCVDCRNYMPAADDPKHLSGKCGASFVVSLVTGQKTFSYAFESRVYERGQCQTEAILFVPKSVEVCNG